MGFYIELNRSSLRKQKFFQFLKRFTFETINLLKRNNYLANDAFKIILLNPAKQELFKETKQPWTEFRSVFNDYYKQFNSKQICLQIISSLNLKNPNTGKKIVVNFDLFLNSISHLSKHLGHFSLDISGDSKAFPDSDSSVDFDEFFLGQKGIKNKHFFDILIQLFIDQNLERCLVKRINVGEASMPFEKLHNAFYAYRYKIKDFERDLLKDFEAIREEIEEKSYLIEKKNNEELEIIWEESFLSKIKPPALEDKIVYLNRENHFIEEYFKEEGIVQEGSFRFFNPEEFTYLYPPIEKFYIDVTEILDKITPWDKIWDEFKTEWQKKHPTIESKKML